jgi:hypothetical protein
MLKGVRESDSNPVEEHFPGRIVENYKKKLSVTRATAVLTKDGTENYSRGH